MLNIKGTNDNLYVNFVIMCELTNRMLKQKVINQNVISSWNVLIDYLKATMGSMKTEQFRILFLNKKNVLIADEILSQVTIDQATIYPREIIKRAFLMKLVQLYWYVIIQVVLVSLQILILN